MAGPYEVTANEHGQCVIPDWIPAGERVIAICRIVNEAILAGPTNVVEGGAGAVAMAPFDGSQPTPEEMRFDFSSLDITLESDGRVRVEFTMPEFSVIVTQQLTWLWWQSSQRALEPNRVQPTFDGKLLQLKANLQRT